jgi:thioredoxin-related protein
MDQQVYPDEEVGNYFNDKFISVRIQMDKTENDSEQTKNWYSDALAIGQQYRIEGYPTFIFLSPKGTILSKEMGGMQKQAFIAMAQTALTPGKVYDDPYVAYKKLKENYQHGTKDYSHYPYMIKIAYKEGDKDFGKQLLEEHTKYIVSLNSEQRYTKENILLWTGFMLNSGSKRFSFFYNDGDKIDKVMQEKGYANKVVDRTVWNEIVDSFLEQQAATSGVVMHGMYLGGPGASRLKTNTSEADWKKLKKIIRQKFNSATTKRNLVKARIEWYKRHRNHDAYAKYYIIKLKYYTPDYSSEIGNINDFIWETFIHVNDKKLLSNVIPWGQKMVELAPNMSDLLDSYANLLYKAGKKEDAIMWQEKAVQLAPSDQDHQNALAQMKKNEPTYLNQGAIWKQGNK